MPPRARIDRYQPEEMLGRSGLVDTFRVRIQGERGRAVLKVLFLERADGQLARTAARRFLDAGDRARSADIPGIARILDVSDDMQAAFVATELVRGVDLGRLLQGPNNQTRPLDPVAAGLLCGQVARVLCAAHELSAPLFHLGLAPGNVIMTTTFKIAVLDFGLSASVRDVGQTPIEKWRFVAPELIGKPASELDSEAARAADWYGLGALFHFLLAGAPVGQAGSLKDLVAGKVDPIAPIPGVPARLMAAVRTLTAPDPKDRPDSGRQVVDWLEGGIASADEREALIAKALTASQEEPSSPIRAAKVPPSNHPSPVVVTPAAPTMARPAPVALKLPVSSPREQVRAARKASRGARVLWMAAGVVILGALALGMHILRQRGPQAGRGNSPSTGSLKASDGNGAREILVASRDAGARTTAKPALAAEPAAGNAEMPANAEGYIPDPDFAPTRVANHLFFDTNPAQADVWIDGAWKGQTPVDLNLGPGGHRLVAIKPGYRVLRAVYDTTRGEFARRDLQRVSPPTFGNAFLEIQCPIPGKYPVVLDDEEIGLLCPVDRLPVASGKHSVGIFVPVKRANVTIEVNVPAGRQPLRVVLKD